MRPSLAALTWLLFFQAAGPTLHSQSLQEETPGTPSPPTLTLAFEETIGAVGQEVSLPIQITATQDIEDPFTIILRFPPSKLEYKKLGVASPPRKAGWKLKPELRKSPPAFDMNFLEISVEPGTGEFLPSGGLLAFAYFQIVEAVPDHAVELATSIKTSGDNPFEVNIEPATITALPEGAFACFFYLH